MGLIQQQKIIKHLVKTPTKLETIHAISKTLKIPYGSTYNTIQQLIKQNIIHAQTIGNATACKINKKSEMLIAHLIFQGIQNKEIFLQKQNKKNQEKYQTILREIDAPIIILENNKNKLYTISSKKQTKDLRQTLEKHISAKYIHTITYEQFSKNKQQLLINEFIVLNKQETIWREVCK